MDTPDNTSQRSPHVDHGETAKRLEDIDAARLRVHAAFRGDLVTLLSSLPPAPFTATEWFLRDER